MTILGIDTGGTYTDGALLERETKRVLKTAKALTTPWDLSVGLENCVDHFDESDLRQISMICLSTTLATNAILEHRGCKAGLILMGSVPDGKLPVSSFEYLPARISIRGEVQNYLREQEVRDLLVSMKGRYESLAVSGYSSVRNPVHEEKVRQMAKEILGIPVVCAHDLTGQLGFYERTVTAVLNARLLPIIDQLLKAVDRIFAKRNLNVPVMVVRGDGSLMQESYAKERPVETILSGPAASMLGSCFLSGKENGLVADMGGTSLDVVRITEGKAEISEEGATVDGWRTRVRALDIRTYALGGDSRIRANENRQIFIGPRKAVPLCRSGLVKGESDLTPTDVAHVTGEYLEWDESRSREGMKRMADQVGSDPDTLAGILSEKIAGLAAEDLTESIEAFGADSSVPVIGVGAPARLWLKKAAEHMGREVLIPEHADVANAVGAAAGKIMELSKAIVRYDRRSSSYSIYSEKENLKVADFDDAVEKAGIFAKKAAEEKAEKAGAESCEVTVFENTDVDSEGNFIECVVEAVASGIL
ncbi:MAG: hydantoinase/oxoprolinase family protein [Bilifractor sp.]|jgi:N-methylhydantoinase A/oxoprolinase/acetone carboxylase beta subunit